MPRALARGDLDSNLASTIAHLCDPKSFSVSELQFFICKMKCIPTYFKELLNVPLRSIGFIWDIQESR